MSETTKGASDSRAPGRPRKLDYRAVVALRRNCVPVPVIAKSFGVTVAAVYHVLRVGAGTLPASSDELREALKKLASAVEETSMAWLAGEARRLLERGKEKGNTEEGGEA